MPLILIVDSDDGSRARMASALIEGGHYCMEAADATDAEGWARTLGIDLIIADAHVRGSTAHALRRNLREQLDPYPVPFVFLLSDEEDQTEFAKLVAEGSLVILPKPPDLAELEHTVNVLLGSIHRAEGKFEGFDESFDILLGRIEATEETGVLTAYRGRVVKKLYFHNGSIVFVSSNDPRELTDRAMLRAGLVSEGELAEARTSKSPGPLKALLRKVQAEFPGPVKAVLTKVTEQSALDLYLWDSGKWFYFGGGPSPFKHVASPVRIDIDPLREEGRKRQTKWPEYARALGNDEIKFTVHSQKFGSGFPNKSAGDQRLIEFAMAGYPIGRIRLELGGQDYAILSRFAAFVERGYVTVDSDPRSGVDSGHAGLHSGLPEPGDFVPSAPPKADIARLLDEAARAFDDGDIQQARQSYQHVLTADPVNADARRGLQKVDTHTTAAAHLAGILPERSVRLAISLEQLGVEPTPKEAFVLSRLAGGPMIVAELVEICPLLEYEVMEILEHYVSKGTLAVT